MKPGNILVIPNEDEERNRDLRKTHLLYLEKLELLNESEREYFIDIYFKFLSAMDIPFALVDKEKEAKVDKFNWDNSVGPNGMVSPAEGEGYD
jgi:hypothetical protein